MRLREHDHGSSPLTRGKPADRALSGKWSGLIPAHAGKTPPPSGARASGPAHPRSRGENDPPTASIADRMGSSPLTRGKHLGRVGTCCDRGLIPAHAGKTNYPCCAQLQHRAHPRSRGENVVGSIARDAPAGSSPLTRGKHRACRWRRENLGLIPAHAGKTRIRRPGSIGTGAHPRSRGENEGRCTTTRIEAGSSPLTRGKPPTSATAASTATAHPRSRGENPEVVAALISVIGSSPLTRGKHLSAMFDRSAGGLIPAHAGKTS